VPRKALIICLWAWLEHQLIAAVKIVPLGQTAGQRLSLD
jgi:urease accessory protein